MDAVGPVSTADYLAIHEAAQYAIDGWRSEGREPWEIANLQRAVERVRQSLAET